MSQSDVATETVLAQIAGLDGECARIDEQIKHLSERRDGIVLMKNALVPLVAGRITGTGALHVGAAKMNESNDSPNGMISSNAAQATNDDHTGHSTSTGFREAVRKVLRDYPKGLRPAEVLAELKKGANWPSSLGNRSQRLGSTMSFTRCGNPARFRGAADVTP